MIRRLSLLLALLVLASAADASAGDGTWRPIGPLSAPRQEVGSAAAAGYIYVAGGFENLGLSFFSARHERYDPLTGEWSEVAPLPAPVHHLAAVTAGGRIFYVGGLRGFAFVATGQVLIYDPTGDSFELGAPMPAGRERGAAGVAVHDGLIYVAGGQRGGVATDELDVYDPVAEEWTVLPDMPRAREHLGLAAVGDRLYAVAGRDGEPVLETDAYDVSEGRWSSGPAPIPTGRGGVGVSSIHGRVIVIGGEGGGRAHDEVEAYNPSRDRWRELAPMPLGRHGIQAPVFRRRLWVAGGADVEGLGPVAVGAVFKPDRPRRSRSRSARRPGSAPDPRRRRP